MYVLIYVDDILVTGSCNSHIFSLLQSMRSHFAVKELGSLHYFLGIEAIRTNSVLFLSQRKYITELLRDLSLDGAKLIKTPLSTTIVLSKSDGDPLPDPSSYQKVIGALQYLLMTRPDLSFVVNKACQFFAT
ncbi:PREDICTED: uncharacterized protein LOC109115038 [Nelumbo nucifera]|uniref:Uncharacterized protein LOC109115038 n=1 Tax=Nelumbo nucifera TaxID=4432 RepID=A0A1U8Q810_NELNU|nr:PREDICTED: uncharacterized protein LOC109115038 [Nelumbo nucifera]